MKRSMFAGTLVIVGLFAFMGSATQIEWDLVGFASPMANVNSLIDQFELFADLQLPEMHTGVGLTITAPLLSFLERGRAGVGIRGLATRMTSRDVSVRASLIGLCGMVDYRIGDWSLGIDLGAYRGGFSFLAARYVGLFGWGGGAVARVGYDYVLTSHITIDLDIALQWLPVYEMRDSDGQRYRGRGTPFLDFSGISASIGITWDF